jgi:hypothetical protein
MVRDSLPELIALSQYDGNWSVYVKVIYQYYLDDVVNANLSYRNLPVRHQFRPLHDGKGFAFWHAISEGESEENRTPDLRRCERIRWIGWLIKHADSNDGINNEVTWWENKRGSNEHVVLFLAEESYVVVLAKRKDYYLFKTAYCANPQRKKQLLRERDRYWISKKTKGAG